MQGSAELPELPSNLEGMAEAEVEPTAAAEATLEATFPPCPHSLPFTGTLVPGWARDLCGKSRCTGPHMHAKNKFVRIIADVMS